VGTSAAAPAAAMVVNLSYDVNLSDDVITTSI